MENKLRRFGFAALASLMLVPSAYAGGEDVSDVKTEESDADSIFAFERIADNYKKFVRILGGFTGLSVLALIIAAEFRLHSKKSEKEPKRRYKIHKPLKVKKIFTKKYWQHLWYLIDDAVIGQKSKSPNLKVAGTSLAIPDPVDASGFLGNLHEYERAVEDTSKTLIFGAGLLCIATNPAQAYENLKTLILGKGKEKK